tara:strand:- start:425 stop:967 length:543 start_codon:yes stop_codon:yes gene_type:complete
MKPFIFDVMKDVIGNSTPAFIGEIGTHKGATATQFIDLLSPRVDNILYYGYDVFDDKVGNLEFHRAERNGKGGVTQLRAETTLNKLKARYGNLEYKLHRGYTTTTLIEPVVFDFVYIDGGHSYETVKHDYSMVKESKLIVFDDLNLPEVKQFIDELIRDGVNIELVDTVVSKHIWGVIRN